MPDGSKAKSTLAASTFAGPPESKGPTRDNSVVSLTSTRTGDTWSTQMLTGRTATTVTPRSARNSARSETPQQLGLKVQNSGRSGKGKYDNDYNEDFDLGRFFNFAEWYGDNPYMQMALALFDKAAPGTPLRTTTMVQVVSRVRFQDNIRVMDTEVIPAIHERDRITAEQVVFSLPTQNDNGGFSWDKIAYRLPLERDKHSKEARLNLLKFLDSDNAGRMTIEDLKIGFARIVSVPGVDDPEHFLDEVIRHAQRAVQDLMLDGAPRHNDDVITKEFRVFLMFLQGYMDLWEIFMEVDNTGDEMVTLNEFCRCALKLKEWGMKDPALVKNPAHVFAQIDKDESGYVTFGEFADFCVRKGLMEEIAQDLRTSA